MAKNNKAQTSIKHDIIESANFRTLVTVSVAVFVVVFCLVAAKSLFSQSLYQQKIISEKKETLDVIKQNKVTATELAETYVSFIEEPINVIGGNPTGSGPRDGDNGTLVLDSLPSELDYPGLSSSIEKILLEGGYNIESIGGDDLGSTTADAGSTEVTGIESVITEIPYPFLVSSSPELSLSLVQTLESSIRPFSINTLKLEGGGNSLEVRIDMKTYYQPAVGLKVGEKVVR